MKTKLLFFLSIVFTIAIGYSQSCIDFTNSTINNWSRTNLGNLAINNDATHGNHLYFTDSGGASYTINTIDFAGNWLKKYENNCLCFDYKVYWTGASTSAKGPKLGIFKANGNNVTSYSVNEFRANFVPHDNLPTMTKNVWKNYCLPIGMAENGELPSNAFGVWKVALPGASTYLTGNAAVNAWNTLIQDVSGLALMADYNSEQTEKIYFDNFCATCTDSGSSDPVIGDAGTLNPGTALEDEMVVIDEPLGGDFPPDSEPEAEQSNCCPPWNEENIMKNMTIKTNPNGGGLNANYTVLFTPTQELKNQMQSYIDYLHSMNPAIDAIIINWRLGKVSGDTCQGLGAEIGGQHFTTWNSGNPVGTINGGNFWSGYPMEVGVWYKLHTGIYLNGDIQYFDKEDCANNDICIRIQIQKNGQMILDVNSNSRILRTSKEATSKAVKKNLQLNKAKSLRPTIRRRQ